MLLAPARCATPIVAAEAYSNKYLTRPTRWDCLVRYKVRNYFPFERIKVKFFIISASRSSSTASGNEDILHRLMKIYCDGTCSTTALKKAIGCDGQRMPLR